MFNTSGINLCIKYKEEVQFELSPYGYSVFPTPFIKQGIISPLLVFIRFVKDQMFVDVWLHF